ncbi:MAG: hypothetical protein PHS82_00255 [Lachnospiraceae bacterium]|nr:hypothetical protein [Lachnospiraceae bacterium]
MSAKTKIVVLHMKEVIYTAIFLGLALVLAVLLYLMFGRAPKKEAAETTSSSYCAGLYTTPVTLNDTTFDVAVTVDADRIKSIELINLSETVSAAYPLMEPALEELATQIYATQTVDQISYSEDSKYTSQLLLSAISAALEKAKL